MGRLTVTYVRGRFLIGAGTMAVEVDGTKERPLDDKESRTFDLEDGKHTLVFSSSYCTKRVDVNLSGEDSFIVTWDRILGGIRITDENVSDRSYVKNVLLLLVPYLVVLFLVIWMNILNREGEVSTMAFHICIGIAFIYAISLLVIVLVIRSRTVVREKEGDA